MEKLTRAMTATDNPESVSARARRRRWSEFLVRFPDIEGMRVLDLGGRPDYWRHAPRKPRSVVTVNLEDHDSDDLVTAVRGDACAPPPEVLRDGFDLVVSNSLIEHVGGHAQRRRVADVIHAAAPRHWVQTPYRYFPVEPHWLFPGFQFLPFAARVRLTRHWPLGCMHAAAAVAAVAEVELLSITQMRDYFPDSRIWVERWAGLPKSLVAVR